MEQLFKVRKNRLDLFKKRRTLPIREPLEASGSLYKSCPQCKESTLFENLIHNLYVYPHCGHHMELTAREHLRQIMDENNFTELNRRLPLKKEQPAFPGYEEELSHLQGKIDLQEAVACGAASIDDFPCTVTVTDSNFFMGNMGQIVRKRIAHCIECATKKKLPLLVSTTSDGARMQEGILSLVQMTKTSAVLARHSDTGLLYISYLTRPTTGGVSASFVILGDIILNGSDYLVGFARKRVIASTIKEGLPANFQKTELLLEKGFVDTTVKREDSGGTLRRILKLHERGASRA